MKRIIFSEMEIICGGTQTPKDAEAFVGAAMCGLAAFGNYTALLYCVNYLNKVNTSSLIN